ncbi:MAG: SusD/RagB family nutrient-binding outer membrane lipoprotein [Cytophagaceae bacterium]|nr:SusD/RagB family nutrient-binding outer membrane lipoprotein [Cytophagaceae bacterium]
MKKYINLFLLACTLSVATSCKLDLLDNPNAVTFSNADPNFLLNRIEVDFAGFFNGASDPGMRLTRMLNQGSSLYQNAYAPQDVDGVWNTGYASIMSDVKALIPIAEGANLHIHAGAARMIRAYVLMTLVDMFGDVPSSKALDPADFNPVADKGADVYAAALKDLDDALVSFGKTSLAAPTDLLFKSNVDAWVRATNSLKLKLFLSRRLVDVSGSKAGIDALVSGKKLIESTAQNLVFRYGSNLANPDNRHPRYGGQYTTGGGDYQSNFYMWHFIQSKSNPDPRLRYYFYRQVVLNSKDVNEIRCINQQLPAHYPTGTVFCYPSQVGYWGRDHLDSQGIPPDNLRRTAWGVYPAGGKFDNNAGTPVALGAGGQGAGLHPILVASFVEFMLAESALTLGTAGMPRQYLENGIRKSMADVRAYSLATAEAGIIAAYESAQKISFAADVDAYVAEVLKLYDGAATPTEKLDVVIREYWLAAHGNGVESYNFFRRTGSPRGMQPALETNPGEFIRSFFYPSVYANRNSNAKQKTDVATQVFWDTNPKAFIK